MRFPRCPDSFFKKDGFPMEQLKSRLDSRVKGNPDFTYV